MGDLQSIGAGHYGLYRRSQLRYHPASGDLHVECVQYKRAVESRGLTLRQERGRKQSNRKAPAPESRLQIFQDASLSRKVIRVGVGDQIDRDRDVQPLLPQREVAISHSPSGNLAHRHRESGCVGW